MCAGHLEYALPKGRKSDPSFSVGNRDQRIVAMNGFRIRVGAAMGMHPTAATDHALSLPKEGSRSTEWLQHSLNSLDADPQIKTDGKLGRATEQAIKDFQTDHEMTATGIADAATLAAIESELGHHDGCACGGHEPG